MVHSVQHRSIGCVGGFEGITAVQQQGRAALDLTIGRSRESIWWDFGKYHQDRHGRDRSPLLWAKPWCGSGFFYPIIETISVQMGRIGTRRRGSFADAPGGGFPKPPGILRDGGLAVLAGIEMKLPGRPRFGETPFLFLRKGAAFPLPPTMGSPLLPGG